MARQLARRQHRERLAGGTLALLGAVVLVVALFALRHPSGQDTTVDAGRTSRVGTVKQSPSTKHATAKAAPSSPARSLHLGSPTKHGSSQPSESPRAVPLIVLNNTTTQGLAAEAAAVFKSGGWTVTRFDNYRNDIVSTCAYYDPAEPSAKSAAEALRRQYPTIKRVAPKFAELPSGPIVVVLTPDYSAG